jgi:phospholipase C
MKCSSALWTRSFLPLFIVFTLSSVGAQVAVTTYHNDNARTGQNLNETILTPSNVNSSSFGKKFSFPVDGQMYAQPLYVPGLTINGGSHNIVFAATEHDSVYAFDADGKQSTALWHVSFINPPSITPAISGAGDEGIAPEIGITGTPVIDLSTATMYLVAMTNENGNNRFRLHALDITTGAEKPGGPVLVQPTVNGTGAESVNGVITINPGCLQRTGLALFNGIVVAAFGSCSHGWVVGYDAQTLAPKGVFNSTADGKGAGIWMGGGAPAIDSAGHQYLITGADADSSGQYNNSFLKFDSSLNVVDSFTPSNTQDLINNDADLGSGAPLVMPDNTSAHPHELIGAGKDGRIFVIDRDALGGFHPTDQVIQEVQAGNSPSDNFFDTPAYWNGNVYYHGEQGVLQQFSWSNGALSSSPVATASTVFGIHGATPVISANGASGGIVWELQVDQAPNKGAAILHAYDATNVAHELYNSAQASSRDTAGPAVKFTVPTVADAKVFVGTGAELDVYGLLSQSPAVVGVTPNSGSGMSQTFSLQYSDNGGYADIFRAAMIIHSRLDWAGSCGALYNRADNQIRLINDAGTGYLGPLTLGSSGTLQNSQCTINAGNSSASASGNILTLNIAISFTPAFGGSKNTYGWVENNANTSSGWITLGTWIVQSGGGGPATVINHVIFMLQENRSFDNYFGMLNPYRKANGWNIGDNGQEFDVDGIDDKLTTISNQNDEGTSFPLFKLATTCTNDMSSSWVESYGDVNRYNFLASRPILMDGFVHTAEGEAKSNGYFDVLGKRAMGYYDQGFLNYYYFMASQFALSDRWFSPVASKTIPNRIATMTGGTTQGLVHDPSNDDHLGELSIETIFQELDNAGVSWKIYYTDTDLSPPFPATSFADFNYSVNYLYSNPSHATCAGTTQPSSAVGDSSNSFCIDPNHVAPLSQYFTDVQNGTLPHFAYIEPGYNHGTDEHPSADITLGQQQVAKIVNAFMSSSSWKDSVFFLSYDEGGGPYDHVPPVPGHTNDNTDASLSITTDISSIAVNPDQYNPCPLVKGSFHCDLLNYGSYADPGYNSGDAAAQQGFAAQLGFRVPGIVISPFTRRHYVSHIPMDHTAIIKFVENRFIGSTAHLTAHDAAQPNLLDFFDFNAVPWATPPSPPSPSTASACNPGSL